MQQSDNPTVQTQEDIAGRLVKFGLCDAAREDDCKIGFDMILVLVLSINLIRNMALGE